MSLFSKIKDKISTAFKQEDEEIEEVAKQPTPAPEPDIEHINVPLATDNETEDIIPDEQPFTEIPAEEIPVPEPILLEEEVAVAVEEIVEEILAEVIKEVIEEEIEEEQVIEEHKEEEKKSFFSKISSSITTAVEKTTEAVKSTLGVTKIKEGLTKTRKTFSNNLRSVLGVGRKIDDALLDEIEELLILADIGIDTTEQIISNLRKRVKSENWENSEDLYKLLRQEIEKLMVASPSMDNDRLYELDADNKPYIILVIGVNGVGKTTTIGKLAYNYKNAGKDVIIGAADTFRAAANEQLEIWAQRAGVDIVQQDPGADPAAVAYDTLKSAQAKNKDVVIIDTAGRLHNKTNLMAELEKITRVMRKLKENAPDEVYLVLDATTGQNAIFQAKEFAKVAPLTGIVLTKLDGTAKGGVVIPIANELKIPVRYIGVGEKIDDLQPFDAKAFVEGLFEEAVEEQ
ncbi:MAG: signal recognition particle-docking protein FtsY [Ignavibacteria bacterium]|jgi:fused signal recognition particle receptor|nr:signal recognition particle-docking protein FtsY [Ignavibacteria bacterium]